MAGVAPGLTFTFKGEEKPTGELGVEYTGARFAVKSEVREGGKKGRTEGEGRGVGLRNEAY